MVNDQLPKGRVAVAKTSEIGVGERKIIDVKGRSIGIFNVNGEFVAVLNVCPHELAPVCRGRVDGTTFQSLPGVYNWGREGEILFCPWHGWEFDLLTGDCLTDHRRLHKFKVEVEDDTIFIWLRPPQK